MIKYIVFNLDRESHRLEKKDNGAWEKSINAPSYAGVYGAELYVVYENGSVDIIDDTDNVFGNMLRLYVMGNSLIGKELIEYLPRHLREFREFIEVFESQGIQLDRLIDSIGNLVNEATINKCSVNRLVEWEKFLNIKPAGEVWQRRDFVIATLRGGGKLNESKIASIVNAFTGGTATTTFINSTINVRILPPKKGDIFRFDDVVSTIDRLKPAHVGLEVKRHYSTWKEIKETFASWGTIQSSFANWQEVKDYVKSSN